jgi:hypothetical protein
MSGDATVCVDRATISGECKPAWDKECVDCDGCVDIFLFLGKRREGIIRRGSNRKVMHFTVASVATDAAHRQHRTAKGFEHATIIGHLATIPTFTVAE